MRGLSLVAIDPKWLIELAPKFYKQSSGKTLSKEKKQEKLKPVFFIPSRDDTWRMSKKKG